MAAPSNTLDNKGRTPAEAGRARLSPLARLPVFFALNGKRVVLAGGSDAAAWKAELLAACGARLDVYAREVSDAMAQVVRDPPAGAITLHHRAWHRGDIAGATVAVGAFEDDESANEFCDAARAVGVAVNVIDKPAFCDFSFGAIVNRSPLVIGISTDGAAPVFAQAIRAKLEAMLPQGFAAWASAASRWREAVKSSGLSFSGRRKFWQIFTAHAVVNPQAEPTRQEFDRFIAEVKGLGASVDNGSVTLVGAGPGDPELLTLRAVRALQSADVILFDDLVSRDVLDFARREARKLLVGKTGFGPSCKQEEINDLMVSLAKQGKRVLRLKGGDPLIFGRAAEEIEACKAAGLAIDIVPGITAAQGAAAKLGITLTGRSQTRRLQYITGHAQNGQLPEDIDWRALTDPATTTAIYMPSRTLGRLVTQALAQGLDPATPAVAVSRATRPDQTVIEAPIAELSAHLAKAALPGPILVMVGQVCAPDSAKASFRTASGV
jgi:uroporphyrin-III C-methyltransferase/precorrin-2 dehydrogenase/sirohydrochlorin ferrochelatase